MNISRTILKRLHVAPLLRAEVTKRFFKMQVPTFSAQVHDTILSQHDYFRFATIGLALQRIRNEQIEGEMAEVGVYRGDVSKLIHSVVPDKKLYLFDTFEGFPKQDLEPEVRHDGRFQDTSVEVVMKKIGNTVNIIIRKGCVPETFQGLEASVFSFVLLDLDLYNPTKASLNFFYPKLTTGGYLFVHDYNNAESNWACKRAVDEFMSNKKEKLIEIGDHWGTVIMRKG